LPAGKQLVSALTKFVLSLEICHSGADIKQQYDFAQRLRNDYPIAHLVEVDVFRGALGLLKNSSNFGAILCRMDLGLVKEFVVNLRMINYKLEIKLAIRPKKT
jgi:hypothetical protein